MQPNDLNSCLIHQYFHRETVTIYKSIAIVHLFYCFIVITIHCVSSIFTYNTLLLINILTIYYSIYITFKQGYIASIQ